VLQKCLNISNSVAPDTSLGVVVTETSYRSTYPRFDFGTWPTTHQLSNIWDYLYLTGLHTASKPFHLGTKIYQTSRCVSGRTNTQAQTNKQTSSASQLYRQSDRHLSMKWRVDGRRVFNTTGPQGH
jgi:hypothetical protein